MTMVAITFWIIILIAAATFSGLQAIKYNDYLFVCFYASAIALGLKFILNIPIFSFIFFHPVVASLILILYLSLGVFYIIKIYWPRYFNEMFELYRSGQYDKKESTKADFINSLVYKDYFMADKNKNKLIISIIVWPSDLIWNVIGNYVNVTARNLSTDFFEMLYEKIEKNIHR